MQRSQNKRFKIYTPVGINDLL